METLRKINRTLLEIQTAVLFWTVLALGAGALFIPENQYFERTDWCLGLAVAGVLVMISLLHMNRCLERGLDLDESAATKVIFRGYVIRYMVFALVLAVATVAEILNPVILCLGYLLIMKVAVYSQPFTHKFYNMLFHEKDPIPEPLVEESEVSK